MTSFTLALLPSPAAAASCPGADESPSGSMPATVARAVVCEINRRRAQHDLGDVRPDRRLARMAGRHARAMVRERFFSHVNPGGGTMAERLIASRYGSGRWWAGEVLAWGTGDRATPVAIVAAWMRSPPHRAVLLGPRYRDVGIGMTPGSPRGAPAENSATYVGELGRTEG